MSKISIIVPVYNVEPYIHRCIDSILKQTFTDFDLILVDDGSPDNCGKICDEYAEKDTRVYVIHKDNGGLSDARNAGINWSFASSDSEWLTFIDSDDWVHKEYLYYLYSLANNNNLSIVSCRFVWTDSFLEDCDISDLEFVIDSPEQLLIDYSIDIASSCLSLYRKKLFQPLRFPVGKLFEDLQTIPPVLYSQSHLGLIQKQMYYRYVNATSITHSEKTPKWINDLLEAHIISLQFFGEKRFVPTFNIFLKRLKQYFTKYIKEYGNECNYKKVFIRNYNQAKAIVEQYESLILFDNTQLKEYGFKKWIIGLADELEQLDVDTKTVQREHGWLFAIMWRIKNWFKIEYYYSKYQFNLL